MLQTESQGTKSIVQLSQGTKSIVQLSQGTRSVAQITFKGVQMLLI